jgi:RNA polymerase sigma-70 factor (ECF subfamily)
MSGGSAEADRADPVDWRARMLAAQAGDPAALEHLCANVMPRMERLVRARLGEQLRARYRTSDFVQSTMLEVLASLTEFRGGNEAEFVRWTERILENNLLDRRRFLGMAKRHAGREEPLQDGSAFVELGIADADTLASREELHRVACAMVRLPKDQQRVLHLVALRGLSHRDAARELERTEDACRALLARARAALLVEIARNRVSRDG